VPKADFFHRLGLYSDDHFLDDDACRRLRMAVQAGGRSAGTVGVRHAAEFVVDPSVRSVRWVDVGETLASEVGERLLNSKSAVEAFYNVPLRGCEPPQFLAYAVGDHYKAHRDSRPDATASAASKARRISAVIFLNDQSEDIAPDRYGGGALTFYGLIDQPSGDLVGIPLEPAAGLLMTFPSDMLHAVAPVTHGERYTIATWFF
jgi:SM-20-related protein